MKKLVFIRISFFSYLQFFKVSDPTIITETLTRICYFIFFETLSLIPTLGLWTLIFQKLDKFDEQIGGSKIKSQITTFVIQSS